MDCSNTNATSEVGFLSISENSLYEIRQTWSKPRSNESLVSGFFTGCTPLEAVLRSTLDCLYKIQCLELLKNKFPGINETFLKPLDLVSNSKQQIIPVKDHLVNLFIEEWSTEISYSQYFHECAPSICTYVISQSINFSYAFTLFIGLYVFQMTYVYKFGRYMKQLNLFKSTKQQTEDDIKNQKIITRVYLVLLTICSSDLVKHEWISLLIHIKTGYNVPDWRNRAFSKFHLLSDLCKLAKERVEEAISHFLSQPFIVSNILSETDFNLQINATLEDFFQSTNDSFTLLVETERLLMQVDQPYSGPVGGYGARLEEENPIGIIMKSLPAVLLIFMLTGPRNVNPEPNNCTCGIDIQCRIPLHIYDVDNGWSANPNYMKRYTVPGSFAGCTATESLLLSTLECYYSNTNCLSILMNYSEQTYRYNVEYPTWFDVHPLIFKSESSRFPPNTSISTILKNIFMEQWNSAFVYDLFYKSCAPNYCTYLTRTRQKPIEVLIKFISMIGGLIISLRLIVPQLVKCVFFVFTKINKGKQQQQQQQIHSNRFNRLNANVRKLFTLLYASLIELNIFSIHNFGSNIDRIRAKRLGQWATHLYLILFVCSSPFTSNEGRSKLAGDSIPTISEYTKDYRHFLSAHLQFLQGLCQLSSQTVNITIQQFRFSLFTTAELLSETNFDARLNLTIEQKQSNASGTFTRLLLLIRNLNQGNAFISSYGTNFEYDIRPKNIDGIYVPSKPLIYNNTCSCGLYSTCTIQATFKSKDLKNDTSVQGLKMGCIPSESFRASSLECFYNESCINLILHIDLVSSSRSTSTTTMTASFTTSSTASISTTTKVKYKPSCQLKFQPITVGNKVPSSMRKQHIVADLNGDSKVDLVFFDAEKDIMSSYFGYGNGTFGREIIYDYFRLDVKQIAVGYFNNDTYLDLLAFSERFGTLIVELGNGFGYFYRASQSTPGSGVRAIISADLNNDKCLDIVHTTVSFSNNIR
ncbi:hypothetical protein I4U23_005393 [Adineta vaga]|nr:hypothetical protein I4U23_005393 [Adineta vaga]